MASRGLRSPRFAFFVIFFAALVFLFGGVCGGGFLGSAFGQKSGEKTTSSPPSAKSGQKSAKEPNRPYLRDHLHWNWNLRGRTVPRGESAAGLRFRAYRQKMAMRASRAAAAAHSTPPPTSSPRPLIAKNAMSGAPAALSAAPSASTAWVPLGPSPLASDATGDGGQDYSWVSGRATSVLIDPADTSGNTVLLGGAYGGLWKSTNAGSLSSNPAAVVWQPLIDDQPTLAVGAIALQPGNSNVILVGTGETNNSADSYYGLGILLSTNAGSTWTEIRSEEHTSELQSLRHLVCRLLLETQGGARALHSFPTRRSSDLGRPTIRPILITGWEFCFPQMRVRRGPRSDRKSTRLNSSHLGISYAVFCLKRRVAHELCTLSLHDALLIWGDQQFGRFLLRAGNSAFHKCGFDVDRDHGDRTVSECGPIVSRHRVQQDRS